MRKSSWNTRVAIQLKQTVSRQAASIQTGYVHTYIPAQTIPPKQKNKPTKTKTKTQKHNKNKQKTTTNKNPQTTQDATLTSHGLMVAVELRKKDFDQKFLAPNVMPPEQPHTEPPRRDERCHHAKWEPTPGDASAQRLRALKDKKNTREANRRSRRAHEKEEGGKAAAGAAKGERPPSPVTPQDDEPMWVPMSDVSFASDVGWSLPCWSESWSQASCSHSAAEAASSWESSASWTAASWEDLCRYGQ